MSLVLAGGVAMGAYEAGACTVLLADPALTPSWVAGSSIGAVTAAILAGTPPERRVSALRDFWAAVESEPFPFAPLWPGTAGHGPWRQALNEKSALDALLFGRPGLFRPRLVPGEQAGARDVPALFDLAPLRRSLLRAVDFDLLNAGPTRLTLCCTDVIDGDRVVFDTARGDRIGVDHVLASCALLPLFAPVEVEGRLLGDGALSANTPVDLVLEADEPGAAGGGDTLCFVVELFASPGRRPGTLAASANRATDLAFGNQTRRMLEGWERRQRLRALIEQLGERLPPEVRAEPEVAALLCESRSRRVALAVVTYRADLDEAGMFKAFDFSRATLSDRWTAGEGAMRAAVAEVAPR